MAEFLSDAWVAELDAAARAATGMRTAEVLVVETLVRDDGDHVDASAGNRGYQLRLGPDGASVAQAASHPADVVLVTDRATAWGLHTGALRAQDAFARGDLKVRGRVELVTGLVDVLDRIERAFAPVRAETSPAASGESPR